MGFDHSPRTWTDGEVVTMGMLNPELRDFSAGVQASWATYTPTWATAAGSTQPDLGSGSLTGRYLQVGHTVHFRIVLIIGAGTTYGVGAWRFQLPKQTISGRHNFTAIAVTGSSEYIGTANTVAGTQVYPAFQGTTAGGPNRVPSSTVPFTWAAGDQLYITGTYETVESVV